MLIAGIIIEIEFHTNFVFLYDHHLLFSALVAKVTENDVKFLYNFHEKKIIISSTVASSLMAVNIRKEHLPEFHKL